MFLTRILTATQGAVQTRESSQGATGRRGKGRDLPCCQREDPGGSNMRSRGSRKTRTAGEIRYARLLQPSLSSHRTSTAEGIVLSEQKQPTPAWDGRAGPA